MYNEEDGTFELEHEKPLNLLIGQIGHEGILSQLKTSGEQYQNKLLHSKPENWESITELFSEYKISGVIGKITMDSIYRMNMEAYKTQKSALFEKISQHNHMMFIHENILDAPSGQSGEEIFGADNHEKDRLIIKEELDFLESVGIDIYPYKTNAEITTLSQNFINEANQNLIFRIYIPNEKLWSRETDKIVQLFKDYLTEVANKEARLEQFKTRKGLTYSIYSDDLLEKPQTDEEFQRFKAFLDLCSTDTSAAEDLLKREGHNTSESLDIIRKYSKEARRLKTDIKQEAESRMLNIRHRIEADLLEENLTEESINKIITHLMPETPLLGFRFEIAKKSQNPQNIIYNQQIIHHAQGVIAQEISGNLIHSPEAQEILELINQHGNEKREELTSSLHELEDEDMPADRRRKAKAKVTSFLKSLATDARGITTGLLQKYIEIKLGM